MSGNKSSPIEFKSTKKTVHSPKNSESEINDKIGVITRSQSKADNIETELSKNTGTEVNLPTQNTTIDSEPPILIEDIAIDDVFDTVPATEINHPANIETRTVNAPDNETKELERLKTYKMDSQAFNQMTAKLAMIPIFYGSDAPNTNAELKIFLDRAELIRSMVSEKEKELFDKMITFRLERDAAIQTQTKKTTDFESLKQVLIELYEESESLEEIHNKCFSYHQKDKETIRQFGKTISKLLGSYKTAFEIKYDEQPNEANMNDQIMKTFKKGLRDPRMRKEMITVRAKNLEKLILEAECIENMIQEFSEDQEQPQTPSQRSPLLQTQAPKTTCDYCGKFGHKWQECRSKLFQQSRNSFSGQTPASRNFPAPQSIYRKSCYYCKINGHDITECRNKIRYETCQNMTQQIPKNYQENYGTYIPAFNQSKLNIPQYNNNYIGDNFHRNDYNLNGPRMKYNNQQYSYPPKESFEHNRSYEETELQIKAEPKQNPQINVINLQPSKSDDEYLQMGMIPQCYLPSQVKNTEEKEKPHTEQTYNIFTKIDNNRYEDSEPVNINTVNQILPKIEQNSNNALLLLSELPRYEDENEFTINRDKLFFENEKILQFATMPQNNVKTEKIILNENEDDTDFKMNLSTIFHETEAMELVETATKNDTVTEKGILHEQIFKELNQENIESPENNTNITIFEKLSNQLQEAHITIKKNTRQDSEITPSKKLPIREVYILKLPETETDEMKIKAEINTDTRNFKAKPNKSIAIPRNELKPKVNNNDLPIHHDLKFNIAQNVHKPKVKFKNFSNNHIQRRHINKPIIIASMNTFEFPNFFATAKRIAALNISLSYLLLMVLIHQLFAAVCKMYDDNNAPTQRIKYPDTAKKSQLSKVHHQRNKNARFNNFFYRKRQLINTKMKEPDHETIASKRRIQSISQNLLYLRKLFTNAIHFILYNVNQKPIPLTKDFSKRILQISI